MDIWGKTIILAIKTAFVNLEDSPFKSSRNRSMEVKSEKRAESEISVMEENIIC